MTEQNNTIIYTKTTCPYCINAKQLLDARKIAYKEIIVGENGVTKDSMNQALGRNDLNTVPQVVLRGSFIPGGYTGLKSYFDRGGV